MTQVYAAPGGEGANEPGLAAPAQEKDPALPENDAPQTGAHDAGTARPEENAQTVETAPCGEKTQSRQNDARFAAARRTAEAQRDEAVARLRQENERERTELAAQREQTRTERARLCAEDELRQIAALGGGETTVGELLDMDCAEAFYDLVKKGVSLTEAYKLTHYDELVKRAADAAARQTMHSVSSRSHLTAVAGQTGAGDYTAVPAEVAAAFRLAKPGITDAEIRRRYRRYKTYQRQ